MKKIGCSLISRCKSQERGVVIKPAKESQADRRAGTADAVVLPGVNRRRFGRIVAAKPIRYDDRRMTRKIGENELCVGRGLVRTGRSLFQARGNEKADDDRGDQDHEGQNDNQCNTTL